MCEQCAERNCGYTLVNTYLDSVDATADVGLSAQAHPRQALLQSLNLCIVGALLSGVRSAARLVPLDLQSVVNESVNTWRFGTHV
jgi:hypothetical protein